jgi:hypothetical protein
MPNTRVGERVLA